MHDRRWTLKFDSAPNYAARLARSDADIVLGAGIAISMILFLLMYVMQNTRGHALQLAARMTFALRESEQRYDLAVQGSAQGVWERRFKSAQDAYFSPRFEEMLGFEAHEFENTFSAFESRIHPLERGLFSGAMQAHLERRVPLRVDVRLRTKSAGFRWFRVHGQAIWDEAGMPLRVAGSILDITERREAAQALRLSEERLRLARDGAGRALFDWNVDTDEIFMSDYWAHIIGAPSAPTLTTSQALADLIHPKDTQLQQRRLRDAIKGVRARYEVECRVLRKDGSWRWVQIEGVAVLRNDTGKAMRLIGTIADVSERKEDERIKSEFISMVSHELRTPLTSIHGALAVAAGGAAGEIDAELRGLLGIAHQNSQRLLRLANDILDIDRMEAGRLEFRMERFALPGLVAQAASEVRPYADTLKVDIEMEVAEPLYVNVDEGRFIQVMTNLLANAVKFSTAGSIIHVAVARAGLNARVTVTDQGGGISEDFRRQLFQKFSQSRTAQARVLGGAGLGLSIVRTLTEAMGGQAGYYPASGGGSAFYVDLPEG